MNKLAILFYTVAVFMLASCGGGGGGSGDSAQDSSGAGSQSDSSGGSVGSNPVITVPASEDFRVELIGVEVGEPPGSNSPAEVQGLPVSGNTITVVEEGG